MTRLPSPLRPLLDDGSDEATRRRVWRGIRSRRAAGSESRPLVRVLAIAAVIVVLASAAVWWSAGRVQSAPGRLAIAGGQPVGALLQATPDAPLTVRLTDGSRLVLSPRARLELGENGSAVVSWVLRDGAVRFSVRPGTGRRWLVHAGVATVEVVGTRFTVSRSGDAVAVAVDEGRVRVTSDRLHPAARILRAGQRLAIAPPEREPATVPPTTAAPVAPSPSSPAVPESRPGASRPSPRASALREALAARDPSEAYALLGPGAIGRETVTAGDPATLLSLADVARRSGHPAEAVDPLRRVVRDFPSDPRAGIAAFTLGRVELGSLGDPGGAAVSFERALQLGVPATLRETAHARLVEAWARAGDAGRAAHWAVEYRRLFPAGAHTAQVDRWSAP